jgi:enoyl-CoA hydratase/carnithine racemase
VSFVEAEREGDVVVLTLNRPERLNAVHLAMRDELWTYLCLLRDDPSVRVAILRGAGDRAFSAGADITDFGTTPSVVEARDARLVRDLWGVMANLEIPVIAAIQGFAYGAGLEMSLYCDLRVADETAQFALPEVTLGYIPSAGGTQTIGRHLWQSDAMQMVTTGEPMSAQRAYDQGLVQRLAPRHEVMMVARGWADRLASMNPAAVRAVKRAVVDGLDVNLAAGLELERRFADRAVARR